MADVQDTTTARKRIRRPVKSEADFWSRVKKTEGDGCWEWQDRLNIGGYGQCTYQGRPYVTHRVAWMIEKGEIPKGMLVCHHCDNRKCVRIDHLFLGTYKDNTADMMRKGRHSKGDRSSPKSRARGERHPHAKLTEEQVREIRKSNLPQKELCGIYGLHQTAISDIRLRKSWRHVE